MKQNLYKKALLSTLTLATASLPAKATLLQETSSQDTASQSSWYSPYNLASSAFKGVKRTAQFASENPRTAATIAILGLGAGYLLTHSLPAIIHQHVTDVNGENLQKIRDWVTENFTSKRGLYDYFFENKISQSFVGYPGNYGDDLWYWLRGKMPDGITAATSDPQTAGHIVSQFLKAGADVPEIASMNLQNPSIGMSDIPTLVANKFFGEGSAMNFMRTSMQMVSRNMLSMFVR